MERMRIIVQSVRDEGNIVVALVTVISARRVGGRPAARIEMEVSFPAERLSGFRLVTAARLAAIDFLDIS